MHAVANREFYFEFMNPFVTLHADSRCLVRDVPLRRFGRRAQIEESIESIHGYGIAFFQILSEALHGQ